MAKLTEKQQQMVDCVKNQIAHGNEGYIETGDCKPFNLKVLQACIKKGVLRLVEGRNKGFPIHRNGAFVVEIVEGK